MKKVYRWISGNVYATKTITENGYTWLRDQRINRWIDYQGREYVDMAGMFFREKDVTLWSEVPPENNAVDILGRNIS